MNAAGRFTWTARDVSDAGLIAFALGLVRHVEHGEAVMESSIELQQRLPRIADAWRFFHAARLLQRDSVMSAAARRTGAHIALAVTGWLVLDAHLIEAGATAEFAVTVEPALRSGQIPSPPRDVRYVLTPDGERVLQLADATGTP